MLGAIRDAFSPAEPNGLPATTDAVDPDVIAQILRSERRRHALRHIADVGETTVSELADHVTEVECGPRYTSSDRQPVYITIYQSHLDQLDRCDIIEYDERTKDVTRGANMEAAVAAADFVERLAGGDA